MKVLIIGGVAGGATAAARLRRLDENAEIVILERSGYISYANCGLPYYIGGKIMETRSALVTGAGSGLGFATAKMLKEQGWKGYFFCFRIFNAVTKPIPILRYKIIDALIPAFMRYRARQRKKN